MDHGVLRVVVLLARINNTSITNLAERLRSELNARGGHVSFLEWRKMWRPARFVEAVRLLKSCDVVISNGALADIFSSVLAFSRRLKVLSWLHCHQWSDLKWERSFLISIPYFFLWRLSLIFKDRIVCVSHDVANCLPQYLRKKTFVIYNPVETFVGECIDVTVPDCPYKSAIQWIEHEKERGQKIIIGYGLLRKRKNFYQAIRALSHNTSFSMVIFGSGNELRHLNGISRDVQVDDRFMIFPFVPSPFRMCEYADVYMSNSWSEGFGLANVEAALTGIPVVLPGLNVNIEVLSRFSNVEFYNLYSDESCMAAIERSCARGRSLSALANPYTLESFVDSWFEFLHIESCKR